ncbi:MAG: hypothetical protein JWR69_665 [Pedosphaera sp.]|nr:hypothetical protein [Pedosphaera sp.]
MPTNRAKTPWQISAWILLGAFLNCAGWILSALHQLNPAGYAVVVLLGAMLGVIFWKQGWLSLPTFNFRKQKRRFSRMFPAAFLILASMAFLGGLLHPPVNYDALAYRMPRLLHWLAEGQWHWIHAQFNRLNTRSCGYEWVAAPIVSLLRSDRPLFLIDTTCFLLLPGLFFSMLTRLGVRRRAAWHWMWLLPTGYCYLLQAGSIANDMFGATFGLAAMDLALRARASRRHRDLWLAILAVALLTGSKTSNIPLALPWLIIIFPVLPLLFKRPAISVVVCSVAALASFLPMATLNYRHCGDWTGWAAERTVIGHGDALQRIPHNCLVLSLQNLAPPVFPLARQWNEAMLRLFSPETQERMLHSYEPGEAFFKLPEMQMEECAGLGFGVTALLLVSLAATLRHKKPQPTGFTNTPNTPLWIKAVLITGWLSILPFLTKTGWGTCARLSNPYYGFMVPLLLIGAGQSGIVRRAWWRGAAMIVFVLAGTLVIASPARPLWPARTLLANYASPDAARLLHRAQAVYSVYGDRWDGFAPLRACLPADASVVGVVTFDDPETSLWRPFGGRHFRHVTAADSTANFKAAGVHYVLVSEDKFPVVFSESFEQWLARVDGKVIQTTPVTLRVDTGPVNWFLVRLGFREALNQALP